MPVSRPRIRRSDPARWPTWIGVLLLALGAQANGHEVRPAVLRITEYPGHRLDVFWRQPSDGALAIRLTPRISGGLLDRPPDAAAMSPDAQSRLWRNLDAGPLGLGGRIIQIEGLEHTLIETLVYVSLPDGTSVHEVLSSSKPAVTLDLVSAPNAIGDYLLLGIRHILSGPDHLLFVLALLLIVRDVPSLIKTVTAFTLAHSLTLAASALGAVHLSPALIDTLIALSILYIAPDVLRVTRGAGAATGERPWLIAFCFGLLHGLGFATGLSTSGLSQVELLQALILFNVGVELGQLSFIALALGAIRALRLLPIEWPRPASMLPAYVIGGMASYWVIENGLALF